MNQRRHVHELDRDPGGERRLCAGRRGEEDERGPQPLAAGRERLVPHGGDEARMRGDAPAEPLLERVEVAVEPGHGADLLQRGSHYTASPTCSATIPPAKRWNLTSSKPHPASSSASSSGHGKRRTLAGR